MSQRGAKGLENEGLSVRGAGRSDWHVKPVPAGVTARRKPSTTSRHEAARQPCPVCKPWGWRSCRVSKSRPRASRLRLYVVRASDLGRRTALGVGE